MLGKFAYLWQQALISVVTGFLCLTTAHARIFQNSYVSFQLPDKWSCELSGTEFVCRNNVNPKDAREAIIILTAKEVGPTDSLQQYESHLKTPKVIASRSGQSMQSEVKKVEIRNIANHPWVDGLQLSSEIPNYLTRYLATVKDGIAILVTFSAHKLYYTKYGQDFFNAIASLRVLTTGAGHGDANDAPVIPGGDTLGAGGLENGSDAPSEEGVGQDSGSTSTSMILALAVIIGALGVYLLVKKKK